MAILRLRNPHSAWRYEDPPDGQNDTSVTAWMVVALDLARRLEIKVEPEDAYANAFAGAQSWIDSVTDPDTGRVGYDSVGEMSARSRVNDHIQPIFEVDGVERTLGEAMTAAGLLCRLLMGESPKSQVVKKHAGLLAACTPVWFEHEQTRYADFYSWHHCTEALHRLRGASSSAWNDWYRLVRAALLGSQATEGHAAGSWAPGTVWGYAGGRVYSTSLAVLVLTRPGR